jgi:hypothetical protein
VRPTHVVSHHATLPRYSASELDTALADVSVTEDERSTRDKDKGPPVREAERPIRNEAPAIELDQPGNVKAAIHYLENVADPAVAFDGGNDCTYQTACIARGRYGLSQAACYKLMAKYFNGRCRPPWSRNELKAIVKHAYTYARSTLGGESAEADFAADPLSLMIDTETFAAPLQRHADGKISRQRALRRRRAREFAS